MSGHPQILVVGSDPTLVQTHRLILGTFFEVEAAGRISEAGSILSRRQFDLIVLCDTLSNADCREIADMVVDQRPKPTLFSLLGPGTHGQAREVGRSMPLPGGPLQLVKECASALGVDPRKQRLFLG